MGASQARQVQQSNTLMALNEEMGKVDAVAKSLVVKLQRNYVEMMVCTDLDYAMRLKMHQQQSQAVAIKMQQDAKVNPEEFKKKFRIYNDLEDMKSFLGNTAFLEEAKKAFETLRKENETRSRHDD